jgi:hypothetical protein
MRAAIENLHYVKLFIKIGKVINIDVAGFSLATFFYIKRNAMKQSVTRHTIDLETFVDVSPIRYM